MKIVCRGLSCWHFGFASHDDMYLLSQCGAGDPLWIIWCGPLAIARINSRKDEGIRTNTLRYSSVLSRHTKEERESGHKGEG